VVSDEIQAEIQAVVTSGLWWEAGSGVMRGAVRGGRELRSCKAG